LANDSKLSVVVAVSGGVDSVVLLDMIVNSRDFFGVNTFRLPKKQVIVAHFDHGIRADSASDEAFVRNLASQYDCTYRSKRVELGPYAGEDLARKHRYAFLYDVCREFNANLATAHHMDDIAETVAINLVRGTGWRGLAVMDNPAITRPFLGVTKKEILQYATDYKLTWHEDSTNALDKYLRNRLRRVLSSLDCSLEIAALRARQVELKRAIDEELAQYVDKKRYERYFFTHCGDVVATEILRAVFLRKTGNGMTMPVRQRALHAIKTARNGSTMHVSDGVELQFTKTHFIVEETTKVLS
jgi:tRNA(Ile)-lysidine synthase